MSEYVIHDYDIGPITRIEQIENGYRCSIGYTAAMIDEMARRVNEELSDEIMERLGLARVVRCRDCKWFKHNSFPRCDLRMQAVEVDPDGFCAWASRRDDAE